jgi:hypothetical protein
MHPVLIENPIRFHDYAMTVAAAAALLVLSWTLPFLGSRSCSGSGRFLSRLGRRRLASIATVTATSLIISLVVGAMSGIPVPRNHDEFSYLLAGDTVARGRLTNEQHPHWQHFETMHVLHEPTYQSKFGVANGLVLALGQVVFGQPIVGVWLSTAAACGCVTWALHGWVRPKWALFGGLLAAVHPHVIHWSQMYWGGSVGMVGGALILGAIPRLLTRRVLRPADAIFAALGAAVLVNSRPYEAMVWMIVAAMSWIVGWFFVQQRSVGSVLARVVAPAMLILAPTALGMMYYNWRVTHDPFTLPYSLHTRQYMSVPLFFWSDPFPPKTYRHKPLADQYDVWERKWYDAERTPGGFVAWTLVKVHRFIKDFMLRVLPIVVGIALLPWATKRDAWTRLAILFAIGFAVAWGIIPWFTHHYAGAVVALLILLSLRGFRVARLWRVRGRLVGRAFARLCALSCLLVLAPTFARQRHENTRPAWWQERARVIRELESRPGKHLVIVRYAPTHSAFDEWVFNGADPDSSRVVFAREMSPDDDTALIQYFADRQAWLLEADAERPAPRAYPSDRIPAPRWKNDQSSSSAPARPDSPPPTR